jgi:ribosomal protein L15
MAGARSILTAQPYQTPGQLKMAALRAKVGKTGRPSRVETQKAVQLQSTTAIVQNLVDRKRGVVTVKDVTALAKVTGDKKLTILRILEEAKEKFSGAAVEYVDIHKQATQAALANGDAKSLAVATAASQWAIEKISADGKRIIDKEVVQSGHQGTKILIGIQLGGKNPTYLEAEPIVPEAQ